MALCFVALIVFGILGIFSAKYRRLAKEAFDCVFRKATLRRCQSGLDKRLRASVSGKLFKLHPMIGSFVFKRFEILSLGFTLLMLFSIVFVGIGAYNYYLYGNCNGPNSDGFCVFDPTGSNEGASFIDEGCTTRELLNSQLTLKGVDTSVFLNYSDNEPNTVIFMGCYGCPYTREAYPDIKKLISRDDVGYLFVHFPTKDYTTNLTPIINCAYESDVSKSELLNDLLFTASIEELKDQRRVDELISQAGFDASSIRSCASSDDAISLASYQKEQVIASGLYGTPTVWVNDKPVIGPKPYRVYKRLLV